MPWGVQWGVQPEFMNISTGQLISSIQYLSIMRRIVLNRRYSAYIHFKKGASLQP